MEFVFPFYRWLRNRPTMGCICSVVCSAVCSVVSSIFSSIVSLIVTCIQAVINGLTDIGTALYDLLDIIQKDIDKITGIVESCKKLEKALAS